MNVSEISITILMNALPIIILFIPLLFFRKKTIGKLYFRICLGISIFYFIYWILPLIVQLNITPDKLAVQSGEESLSLGYISTHFGSLITIFAYYPLVALPFIFFVSPFISFVIYWNKIRKEEGSIRENLLKTTYEYNKSPLQAIKAELHKKDWNREVEILKLMLVLLPISLYILQVILKVTGLEDFSLQSAETALGWFLEILFVYLAIFIFSIELIFSSKIAIKGKYVGERIREQIFRSLYMVGLPISAISVFLFILEYSGSYDIIFFFFAYFMMATFIFILFLDIFEPLSVLILIKAINWWKNREEKTILDKSSNLIYGVIFGFAAVAIFFIVYAILSYTYFIPVFGTDPHVIVDKGIFNYSDPTLLEAIAFDALIIFDNLILVVLPVVITGILLYYSFKYSKSIIMSLLGFMPIVIILSLVSPLININPMINFASDDYWLIGKVSYTSLFGIDFYTLRSAALEANLTGVLGILAIPYIISRNIINIIIWSLLIYYLSKRFRVSNIPIDEKHIRKVIFTDVDGFISYDNYIDPKNSFLVSRNKDITLNQPEQEREEVKTLLNSLEMEDKLLESIKPTEKTEIERFFFVLKYLFNNHQINIWKPEFSYLFERVKKQGLYIIYDDGRGVYDYSFSPDAAPDPGLISGMFSAITSFVKETTKSTEVLKTIDHGDITILIEYGKQIFGALFIKGNQSSEIRSQLNSFVSEFEETYKDVLEDWTGTLAPFQGTNKIVVRIFEAKE